MCVCFSVADLRRPRGLNVSWNLVRVKMMLYLCLHDMLISIVINSTAACKFSCADSLQVMAVRHQDTNDWTLHYVWYYVRRGGWLQTPRALRLNDRVVNYSNINHSFMRSGMTLICYFSIIEILVQFLFIFSIHFYCIIFFAFILILVKVLISLMCVLGFVLFILINFYLICTFINSPS